MPADSSNRGDLGGPEISRQEDSSDGAAAAHQQSDDGTDGLITLTIRRLGAPPFELPVNAQHTKVSGLKQLLVSETHLRVEEQRAVFAGRVLEDGKLLKHYGLKNGDVIHLVKVASNRAQEQSASATPGRTANAAPSQADYLRQMADSPLMQMLTANPEFLRTVIMSNPEFREMVERNPEIGHIINDPSFLRQSLEIARNPQLGREVMRSSDRALSNIEMLPGGFNHIRRMYETMQGPLESAGRIQNPSTDEANREYARRLNVQNLQPGQLNNSALPNPWQPLPPQQTRTPQQTGPPSFASQLFGVPPSPISVQPGDGRTPMPSATANSIMQMQQLLRGSGGQPPAAPSSNPMEMLTRLQQALSASQGHPGLHPHQQPQVAVSPEIRFRAQLESLEQMGFVSRDSNLRALAATDGNVQAAVDFLLRDS